MSKALFQVALFTRAWIEMLEIENVKRVKAVALFTRAWIEINFQPERTPFALVALFTRAWIEIWIDTLEAYIESGRPLHEGVD